MSTSQMNNGSATVQRIQRDHEFYVPGGDIIFLAGTKLFRVHRYFLERESLFFRQLLDLPDPMPSGQVHKGMSDSNPIGLDDVDEDSFAKFLWVFYNPSYSEWDGPIDQWAPIIQLAHRWGFASVKKLCVRQLEKLTIPHIDKIVLYRDNEIDQKLLIPAYSALCHREQPINREEGKRLGLDLTISIAEARERSRALKNGSMSPVSLADTDMSHMLVTVLRLDDPSAHPPIPPSVTTTTTTVISTGTATATATTTTTGPQGGANGGKQAPPPPPHNGHHHSQSHSGPHPQAGTDSMNGGAASKTTTDPKTSSADGADGAETTASSTTASSGAGPNPGHNATGRGDGGNRSGGNSGSGRGRQGNANEPQSPQQQRKNGNGGNGWGSFLSGSPAH